MTKIEIIDKAFWTFLLVVITGFFSFPYFKPLFSPLVSEFRINEVNTSSVEPKEVEVGQSLVQSNPEVLDESRIIFNQQINTTQSSLRTI